MDKQPQVKETEFDSSLATLIRIDFLIKALHDVALDFYNQDWKHKRRYLDLIDRLYLEGRAKFTKDEESRSQAYDGLLCNLAATYNKFLYDSETNKAKHLEGWSKIKNAAREYEFFIMRCLDRHNMLLRDSKDAMTKFRTG